MVEWTTGKKKAKSSKTLSSIFGSADRWWNECKKYLHFASPKDANVVSAFFWETILYTYLEDTVLAGRTASTVKQILAESALDFVSIKRKDDMWRKIFPKLDEQFKLLQIRTSEHDWHSDKVNKTQYGQKKEDTKTAPILGMTSNKVSGVDWGEISKTLLEGFYQDGKFNPNVENTTDSGLTKKTTDTKQQRQQQIGRIIQAVLAVDVDFTPLLHKYWEKYAWKWASPPGDVSIDYTTGSLRFKPSIEDYEDDDGDPDKKKTTARPDLDDISQEQWEAKRDAGESVELSWDLECWARYIRRIQLTVKGKSAASQEVDNRKIKALRALMDIFSRDIYIPPLTHYDRVMNSITGFKYFKKELRDRMETSYVYRTIGEKQDQVFYCLLGKPGVGKTEICKTLAKAMNRPICILSMGGATETKPLEGIDPAWKASSWSDILETMVEKKSEQVVMLDETEKELKMYKALKKPTEFQKQKIVELEEIVKKIKESKQDHIKMDLGCKAPIILLDEAEKVKHPSVLDAMGKILDDNVNWSHMDKFLEYRINLGYCLIFVTMNWFERAPDFIRDRCKFVDIELLTYAQRKDILEARATAMVRKFFPVLGTDGKVDHAKQKELANAIDKDHPVGKLTHEQQRIRNLIDNRTIEACITQSWGIRGGIMNLKKVIDLLVLIDVRAKAGEAEYAEFLNSSALSNYDWDSEQQDKDDDDYSDKVRRLRYYSLPIKGASDLDEMKYEELILTKKTDYDFIEKDKNRNIKEVLHPGNQIKDWPNYDPRTDEFLGEIIQADDTTDRDAIDAKNKTIRTLQADIQRIKKKAEEELKEEKVKTAAEREKLSAMIEELNKTGLEKEGLEKLKVGLEQQLANMGVKLEEAEKKTVGFPDEAIPTYIIKEIPTTGVVRFGTTAFEKQARIIYFAREEAPKLKKFTINECPKIIKLDFDNCVNLEKLSIKNSQLDAISNLTKCLRLKKVSIKNSISYVPSGFLVGTTIEELKIT